MAMASIVSGTRLRRRLLLAAPAALMASHALAQSQDITFKKSSLVVETGGREIKFDVELALNDAERSRGLMFRGRYLFVGTSRVLPRYRHYAPGLDPDSCRAGVHVLDAGSGKVLGSVEWPAGNQLFAIESMPRDVTIVFIEHDMDLVFRFAERITVLVGGKVLTEATPAEIAADKRVKEVYLGEALHV